MKKFIIVLVLASAFVPALAFASFEADVSYGMQGAPVLEVQEFLGTQGCFNGPYTGNFYSLTLAGVKCFQKTQGINTTGYFGPLSRAAAQKIVSAETSLDEVSTTTAIQAPATPSKVFTLPNGIVVAVAPDGTITTLYSPTAPQALPQTQTATTTSPIQSAPMVQSPSAGSAGASVPSQPAPEFARTGSVNGSLLSGVSTITIGSSRVVVATISVENKTNETILFSNTGNISTKLQVSANTVEGWTPQIQGIYKSQDFSNDNVGIKAGETGTVQLLLTTFPTSTGSVHLVFTGFNVVGQTSGDIIPVDSSYFDLGTVAVN